MKVTRLAVPDFISNSYFPAIAAVALGYFQEEGLDVRQEQIFPSSKAFQALRDGAVDFVAAPAHALLSVFPEWHGVKLLAALAQGTYWMLVLRSDLKAAVGDVSMVKGRRIGAAPMVDLALKRLIADAGIDLVKDAVEIVEVPGARDPGTSFGIAAARALENGTLDGFWANGLGAETAVRSGVGEIILDVRRGLGPAAAFHYTFPVLAASDQVIARDPEMVEKGIRAVLKAQRAVRADVSLAGVAGHKLFPPAEAGLIQSIVARDVPYYTPEISEAAASGLISFSQACGLLKGTPSIDQVVAMRFAHLWSNPA
jgi:NitT/TauT family transport system substrate-binding protein